jgi:hypothetical protein
LTTTWVLLVSFSLVLYTLGIFSDNRLVELVKGFEPQACHPPGGSATGR